MLFWQMNVLNLEFIYVMKLQMMLMQIKIYLLSSMIMLILVIIMILITVAFFTLFERKIMALFHYRKGPNKISLVGMFQPFSDALKLFFKEFFFSKKSNFFYYIISPMLMLLLSMSLWLIYPFTNNLILFKLNSLYIISMISMGVYGLMISGWSSNSSFSMIGSIRSIAQSISYEIIFSITMLIMLMMINSFNLNLLMMFNKNYFNKFLFFIPIIFILISMLAEINRTPFDLSEGESELVSGFNVEYSSGKFILIFLAEYSSILFMMFLLSIFILYKFNLFFFLFIILLIYLITWIRMTYPRIRYDKLMFLCWFFILPFSLINFLMYIIMYKYLLETNFILNLSMS
uniref:NADH-ubiquinone oxidoreductase chain 1 n=1 Tax=Homolobus sp. QL-2013 TaxID=1421595 RepID=A0A0A6ZL18_9HYME|nr:NADH dehydrogenase subunit 1 [Homolobus sp. QL-2013]